MAIVFPGIINAKERLNFEQAYVSAFSQKFFRFNIKLLNTSTYLITIPQGHLIYSITPIVVEEPFNGSEVFLNIGTTDNEISILHLRLNNITNILILPMFSELGTDFGKVITVPVQLFMGIGWEVSKPTKGSGYGIITLLNLNHIDGYK